MKIWIAGAFSTGKTTLAKELSTYLPDYKLDINIERDVADLLEFDFNNHTPAEREMYQRYLLQKTTMTATSNENLITDTPVQVLMWYAENQQVRLLTQQAMINLYDILLYLPPEISIKDDGVRNTDKKYQAEVDEMISDACCLTAIKNRDCILRTINWNFNERLVDAMQIIKDKEEDKLFIK